MPDSATDQVNRIPDTMQSAICHGPENYQLEEVAVPRPGPGEALIKVEATGICASDLKCYHDKELDVRGAHLGPNCWPAAIRMLESGRLPMERICTHQLPLADFQKGLDMVPSGKESIKVSLIP
jgi:threonine dehydrogenase-like Zn-dependent dehydrogenase